MPNVRKGLLLLQSLASGVPQWYGIYVPRAIALSLGYLQNLAIRTFHWRRHTLELWNIEKSSWYSPTVFIVTASFHVSKGKNMCASVGQTFSSVLFSCDPWAPQQWLPGKTRSLLNSGRIYHVPLGGKRNKIIVFTRRCLPGARPVREAQTQSSGTWGGASHPNRHSAGEIQAEIAGLTWSVGLPVNPSPQRTQWERREHIRVRPGGGGLNCPSLSHSLCGHCSLR